MLVFSITLDMAESTPTKTFIFTCLERDVWGHYRDLFILDQQFSDSFKTFVQVAKQLCLDVQCYNKRDLKSVDFLTVALDCVQHYNNLYQNIMATEIMYALLTENVHS